MLFVTWFFDREKVFDRFRREVMRWAMKKSGVDEWLVQAVMTLYSEVRTENHGRPRGSQVWRSGWYKR